MHQSNSNNRIKHRLWHGLVLLFNDLNTIFVAKSWTSASQVGIWQNGSLGLAHDVLAYEEQLLNYNTGCVVLDAVVN